MKPNIRKTDVYVNGIILTPEAINALDYLQTGGTLDFSGPNEERTFDNNGLENSIEDLDGLQNFFVKKIDNDNLNELAESQTMLRHVNSLRYWLNMFAAPVE